jgi:hypothetical protein
MRNFNKNLLEQLAGANSDAEGDALPIEQQIKNPVLDPSMSVEQLMDQRDAPLFVQPSELQSTEVSDINTPSINKSNYMDAAQQEADSQSLPMSEAEQDFNYGKGVVESGQETPESFAAKFGDRAYQPATQDIATLEKAPMSPQEKMMAEYKAMQEQDRKDLQEARSSDRNLKMGGAIGDALATYLNARGQMNVKAPGVQVQQGAGLGKIADMFATSPDIAADLKSKREDLLAQYKLLSKGNQEITPYQKAFLAMKEKDQTLREQSQQGTQGRHEDTLGFKTEQRDRLSDKQLEAADAFSQTLRSLERVKALKEGIDTGPVADIRNQMAGKAGINDPNVTALRTEILDTLASKIKALSGTAASEAEVKRLAVTLPQVSDNDEVFNRQLEDAMNRVKEAEQLRMESYKKQGKNVESFQAPTTIQSKDQKALDWAKANPNDPRSAAILKKLGM